MADPTASSNVPQTLNLTGAVVGVMMTSLLGFTLWALIFRTVPDANQNVLLVVIGALTTNVTGIVSYFFGASLGSRQKDTTIAVQSDTAAKAQAALAPIVAAVTAPPGDGGVVLKPGQHVDVAATPVKPQPISQAEWDALSDADKKAKSAK